MDNIKLFKTQNGDWVTSSGIISTLDKIKAWDAHILFMHTGLTFGAANPALGRQQLLTHLFELITGLGVPTLCVPTFTFSFCNGADYHIEHSRSRMGALNEYIRKLPEAVRSIDPLLSVAIVGSDLDLVRGLGKNSIGANSTFDRLHQRGAKVKFLFLGTSVSDCFTYTHYVEERLNAPYRYNREFTGMISDGKRCWKDTYTLFVRYQGVVPSSSCHLENYLLNQGSLHKQACGDSSISCLDELGAYEAIVKQFHDDAYCYIRSDPGDRNTEFIANNMVAL